MMTSVPSAPARLGAYVLSVAIGSTAYIALFTAQTIAAREITGSAELAGLPSSLGTLGTAFALGVLTAIMARAGRRRGLVVGYGVAVAGAAASVFAISLASFPLLAAGGVAVGFGNAALQLTRYAAADLVDPARRARALSIVVWASTVGAVLGPNLVDPAGRVARALGRPPLEGGLAVTALAFAAVVVIAARTAPRRTPHDIATPIAGAGAFARLGGPVTGGRLSSLRAPRVRVALLGLLAGQIVMNLIMTMTPVHVHEMGEPLSTVGFVISAHTLGMFALAPLSARVIDRFGQVPVILAGFVVLAVAAVLAAIAMQTQLPVLVLGLFLLGYGWNLSFVAGSSLLALGSSVDERIRLQGLADVLVWTATAAAGASSGLILEAIGYQGLATVGGILLVLPAAAVLVLRRGLSVSAEPATA
jgi:MFS family permease